MHTYLKVLEITYIWMELLLIAECHFKAW